MKAQKYHHMTNVKIFSNFDWRQEVRFAECTPKFHFRWYSKFTYSICSTSTGYCWVKSLICKRLDRIFFSELLGMVECVLLCFNALPFHSEYYYKYNTSDNVAKDTMNFTLRRTWVFQPQLSDGLTGDEIITTLHPGSLTLFSQSNSNISNHLCCKSILNVLPHENHLPVTLLKISFDFCLHWTKKWSR